MTTYRNTNWTTRNYECMNVVACKAAEAPNENWTEDENAIASNMMMLYVENGVEYYGYA